MIEELRRAPRTYETLGHILRLDEADMNVPKALDALRRRGYNLHTHRMGAEVKDWEVWLISGPGVRMFCLDCGAKLRYGSVYLYCSECVEKRIAEDKVIYPWEE
jgi:hypothetical protein